MGFLDVGPLELIVVFAVALLVFGPNRLPEVLGQAGRWLRNIRRITEEVTREVTRELNIDDANRTTYSYSAPVPPPPTYTPPVVDAQPEQIETFAEPVETTLPGEPVETNEPAEPVSIGDNRSVTPAFGGHYGMEGELATMLDEQAPDPDAVASPPEDGPVAFQPASNGSVATDEPILNGSTPHPAEPSSAAERQP